MFLAENCLNLVPFPVHLYHVKLCHKILCNSLSVTITSSSKLFKNILYYCSTALVTVECQGILLPIFPTVFKSGSNRF